MERRDDTDFPVDAAVLDPVPDAHALDPAAHLRQVAHTDDLIFDVATLVALISEALTLEPGDIIVTGTPSGVGMARKPPVS